jgi:hypothetical protein
MVRQKITRQKKKRNRWRKNEIVQKIIEEEGEKEDDSEIVDYKRKVRINDDEVEDWI